MDVKQEALNTAINSIKWSLEKLSAKGTLEESPPGDPGEHDP